MASPLFLGGVLNIADPLFGQPLYLYLFLFLIICTIICYVIWRFSVWVQYRPLWGLFFAYKASSKAAFIFSTSLICELLGERDAKCIFRYGSWDYELPNTRIPIIGNKIQHILFNYSSAFLDLDFAHALLYKFGGKNMDMEIARKLQGNKDEVSDSTTSLGGIHVDLILDSNSWSIPDSPQHAIIEYTAEQHNSLNPMDQVHTYPLFQKKLLDGTIVCPPGIEKTYRVNWSRIDAAFPLGMSNKAPGPVREMALEMENEDKMEMRQYYLPILLGGIGFACLLLLLRVVLIKVHF